MAIKITKHAMERMAKYDLKELQVLDCLKKPDLIIKGNEGRKIAQKRLNGYVLRVIYEETGNNCIVITTYKAKRERYEI